MNILEIVLVLVIVINPFCIYIANKKETDYSFILAVVQIASIIIGIVYLIENHLEFLTKPLW